ncbi:MAG: hypothetical protein AB1726_00480 [Planctomycetota bacterium]
MAPDAGRDAELIAAGWKKKTTYDEPRLSEIAAAYRELGFEVRLEPFAPAGAPDCTECMAVSPERFRTIWIRRPPAR